MGQHLNDFAIAKTGKPAHELSKEKNASLVDEFRAAIQQTLQFPTAASKTFSSGGKSVSEISSVHSGITVRLDAKTGAFDTAFPGPGKTVSVGPARQQ